MPALMQSILSQPESDDCEILLLPENEDGQIIALCRELEEAHPQVRMLQHPHKGPSDARNTGIRAAQGEWILFADGDDLLPPDALANWKKLACGHPGIDVFVARYEEVDAGGMLLLKDHAVQWKEGVYRVESVERAMRHHEELAELAVWKVMVKRNVLIENKIFFLYDVFSAEEIYWTIKLFMSVDRVYYADVVVYRYRQLAASLSKNKIKALQGVAQTYTHCRTEKEIDDATRAYVAGLFISFIIASRKADGEQRKQRTEIVYANRELLREVSQERPTSKSTVVANLILRMGLGAADKAIGVYEMVKSKRVSS